MTAVGAPACAVPPMGGDHALPTGRAMHGIHHDAARARTLYQTSTMSALLDGIYDGSVTIAELLEHGDFGVGTFNHLDGEMVVNEGVCFHLFSSGEARVANPDDLTPFAAVTTLRSRHHVRCEDARPPSVDLLGADRRASLEREPLLWDQGHRALRNGRQPNRGTAGGPLPAAGGSHRRPRSERTFTDTAGVLVGFRTPDYEQGISVAGYHLHFLNDGHTRQADTRSTSCSMTASSRSRRCRNSGSACRRRDRSSPLT